MKRKVVKQGHNTLTITLPKKWTDNNNVKPGDEVEMDETGHDLMIISGTNHTKIPLKLDMKQVSLENSRIMISNAYKLGYDEIDITFDDPSDLVEIQKIIDRLIGYEITSNTKTSCVVKCISMINKEEFFSLFKKSFQINQVIWELIRDDIAKEKYPNTDLIMQYYQKVISYTDCCRRIINKCGIIDSKSDVSLYVILLKLNYISVVLRDIYRYLATKKAGVGKKAIDLMLKTEEMYSTVFEGYFKEDIKLVDKGCSMKKKLYDNLAVDLMEKSKGGDTIVISKLSEMIKHTYGATGPIVAILYQQQLKKNIKG